MYILSHTISVDCLVNNWLSAMCDEHFHATCFEDTYLINEHNMLQIAINWLQPYFVVYAMSLFLNYNK